MTKAKTKTQTTKEKWFLLWPDGDEIFQAEEYESYVEAKEQAEEFLIEAADSDSKYFIAKLVEKICYELKHEKF